MPCGVEPVDRVHHADPERRLDLAGLARGQERVEPLERLDVAASGRCRQSLSDQSGDDPVHVLAGDFPPRPLAGHEEPVEHTGAVVHRRLSEPTRDLGRLERPQARVLEDHRIHRLPDDRDSDSATAKQTETVADHTAFFPASICRRYLTSRAQTLKIATRQNTHPGRSQRVR
jgi:hypothetical protein